MLRVFIGLIISTVAFGAIHVQTVSVNATESVFLDYNKTQILQSNLSLIFENGLGKVSDAFKPTNNVSAVQKSTFNIAMDAARGRTAEATTNLKAYPSTASYYPTDSNCDYKCLITRYFYLGLLSVTGYNANRQEKTIGEWEPHTPQLMLAIDPDATQLLISETSEGIAMPRILPNGLYMPKEITATTPTFNIAPTLNATVSQNLASLGTINVPSFNKYTAVFDVHVIGHELVPTNHVLYAANTLAQWLDNQRVGTPNTWETVVRQLTAVSGSALILVPNASTQSLAAINLSAPGVLNGPNPFNPGIGQTTRFQYTLGNDSTVEMHIYSLSGTKVYEAHRQRGKRGGAKGFNSDITWDGRNNHGNMVANGVYVAYFKFTSIDGTVFSKCKVVVYK
jgi:hypothetical protein